VGGSALNCWDCCGVLCPGGAVAAGEQVRCRADEPDSWRNGWTIAGHTGDRVPDETQRLLNRTVWDTLAAAGVVRRPVVAGMDQAATRRGPRSMRPDRSSGVSTPPGSRDTIWAARARWRRGSPRNTWHTARARPAHADRHPPVDPAGAHRRPGQIPGHGPGIPHQGAAGHRSAARYR